MMLKDVMNYHHAMQIRVALERTLKSLLPGLRHHNHSFVHKNLSLYNQLIQIKLQPYNLLLAQKAYFSD